MKNMLRITKELEFTRLEVVAHKTGEDIAIIISGGDKAHIGCAVVAVPRPSLDGSDKISSTASVINLTGHKDEFICRRIAERVAAARNVVVMCSGGVHMDGITEEQINGIMAAVDEIITEIIERATAAQLDAEEVVASARTRRVRDLSIDVESHIVKLKDHEIHVTPMEFKLIVCLFDNIGKVVATKSIIEALWGSGYGNDTQALRAIMTGLRRKIEIDPSQPKYIVTEIGVGYRLLDEEN